MPANQRPLRLVRVCDVGEGVCVCDVSEGVRLVCVIIVESVCEPLLYIGSAKADPVSPRAKPVSQPQKKKPKKKKGKW